EAKHKVMFVSNEMGEADLTARLVAQAGVPHHMCESGQIEAQYKPLVEARLAQIAEWDFRLVDDEDVTLQKIRRHMRLYQPDLLIVDHLHNFHWTERRELELTILGVRSLARAYDIPAILMAQLNRTNDYREPFPRPWLPRLKETSQL